MRYVLPCGGLGEVIPASVPARRAEQGTGADGQSVRSSVAPAFGRLRPGSERALRRHFAKVCGGDCRERESSPLASPVMTMPLPRRADESSEVRSSGDKVPTSASLNVEVGEGRPGRLNARQESSSNLVTATWPKRLTGHDHNGEVEQEPLPAGAWESSSSKTLTGVRTLQPRRTTRFFIDTWESPRLPTDVVARPSGRGMAQSAGEAGAGGPALIRGRGGRARGPAQPERAPTSVWS